MDLEALRKRQAGIGGSDAAGVLGVPTAHRSQLAVYESKVMPITEEESELGPRYWGSMLEDAIAATYIRRLGREDFVVLKPRTFVRPGVPLVGTPDRCFYQPPPMRPEVGEPMWALEVKTADRSLASRWGPTGGGIIPEEYWVQVQHYYMVIPTIVRIDVAVLIGGNDYREYVIAKDESFCKDLLSAELAWWERHVLPKVPPEPTARDVATLKRLYPGTDGSTVDIAAPALHWHQILVALKGEAKSIDTGIELAQAHILKAMGNAAIGQLPAGFGRYQRKEIHRATTYVELRHLKSKGDNGG